MTSETTPTPAPERPPRLPAWHPAHLIGAWRQRPEPRQDRPGDERIRKRSGQAAKVTAMGLLSVITYWFMSQGGGLLTDLRASLRALPGEVAAAIKERNAATTGDAAWVAAEVRALREETVQHQAAEAVEFAQLRGVVAGRLKCPPCPVCPACPPPSLGVPKQPEPQTWRPRER